MGGAVCPAYGQCTLGFIVHNDRGVFLKFPDVCVHGPVKGAGSRTYRNGCPRGVYLPKEGDR